MGLRQQGLHIQGKNSNGGVATPQPKQRAVKDDRVYPRPIQ
jgi:hypothetical protein